MKKQNIILIIMLSMLIIPLVSAKLGTFKQNECVQIVTNLNVTSVNISVLTAPSPLPSILLSNVQMTNLGGGAFNYSFCNTTRFGFYTYGYCDNTGNCYSNGFNINGSGQEVTQSQITLIIIGLVVLLIVSAFFFILSILFKHPGTKIFLMALSSVTLIILIGIIASNAAVYLAEFPNLVSIYNNYYIVSIGLAGACMAGIILWLIYYSVQLFNKSRGRLVDDD